MVEEDTRTIYPLNYNTYNVFNSIIVTITRISSALHDLVLRLFHSVARWACHFNKDEYRTPAPKIPS